MENKNINIAKIVGYSVGGLIALIVLFGAFGTISAGHIGVKTRFGSVVGQLNPGLYFKVPFVEGVTVMNVQTQKESVTAVEAASQDLQTVTTDVTVNYHLNSTDVAKVFQTTGTDYASKIIDPAMQESVKATTAKYTAEQLITQREQVRDDIFQLLTTKFEQFNLHLDSLNITNFAFSAQFNAAIEAKVTAEQNALAAKNKLDQSNYEAQQTVVTAKAQAEAIQIQAQAINSQGGQDYVALQALNKWDGHGCVSQCFGLGTQTPVPFFNLNK